MAIVAPISLAPRLSARPSGDREVRDLLKRHLVQSLIDFDTVVLDELGLCQGDVRIDVAAVSGGELSGFEIKSPADTLARWPRQQRVYSKVVDRAWLVPAHLERYDPPKKLVVPNVVGFDETVDCPGVLSFRIGKTEYKLEPMSEAKEDMWIVFGDATNGRDTYGGGRFLYLPAPNADGLTIVDFNRAYNPPCVFTPYATCPLPTPENRLPVRVEAGERSWAGHA